MQAMSSTSTDTEESRTFGACGIFKEGMLAHTPSNTWMDILAFRIGVNGQVTNNTSGPLHDLSAVKRFTLASASPWMFKNSASAESAVNGRRQLEVLFGRLRDQMAVMVASQKV